MEKNSLLKQIGIVLRHPIEFLRVAVSPPFLREGGTHMSEAKRKKIVLVFEASIWVLLILFALVSFFAPSFWAISILFVAAILSSIVYGLYHNDKDTPVLVVVLRKIVGFLGWLRNHPGVYFTGALIQGVLLWFFSGHFEALFGIAGLAVIVFMSWHPARCCSIEED